jgi:hypothetical protein
MLKGFVEERSQQALHQFQACDEVRETSSVQIKDTS